MNKALALIFACLICTACAAQQAQINRAETALKDARAVCALFLRNEDAGVQVIDKALSPAVADEVARTCAEVEAL